MSEPLAAALTAIEDEAYQRGVLETDLQARIIALEAERDRLRQALAFYADAGLYASLSYRDGPGTKPVLAVDRGHIARAAREGKPWAT